MPTRPTSRRRRLAALAAALVLPAAAVVATPSPAAAGTTYCYTVIAADPSGWIFGWGTADNCIQPVGVEVHLREDISWAPDREVSNHYGSPGQFLDVGSFCQWTPGSWHAYFVETRINVNGSVKQKQQSNRWVIDYWC